MKHRSHLKDTADKLIEASNETHNLKNLSSIHKAAGLMSLLTGKSESDLLLEEISQTVKILRVELQDRLKFFESKSEWNGNIPNLRRELKKCDEIESRLHGMDLEELRYRNKWIHDTKTKYGFTNV